MSVRHFRDARTHNSSNVRINHYDNYFGRASEADRLELEFK